MKTDSFTGRVAMVIALFLTLGLVAPGSAVSAAPADATPAATDRESGDLLESFRDDYVGSNPHQKKKIAEEIGERGAAWRMQRRGLKPLLKNGDKALPQGADQVWTNPKTGRVIVVEAKGGTSKPVRAYGHLQGSSEWSVEAAKRMLSSDNATRAEKEAAQEVLEAASEGNLRAEVIRTIHVQGKPTAVMVDDASDTSGDARRAARRYLDELDEVLPELGSARRGAKSGADEAAESAGRQLDELADAGRHSSDDIAGAVARNGDEGALLAAGVTSAGVSDELVDSAGVAAKVTGKAGRGIKRAAGPAAALAEIVVRGHSSWQTETAYRQEKISHAERCRQHGENLGHLAGGSAGGWAGAKAGALAGAGIGACFGGAGAPVGAAIGAGVGAIGGGLAGDYVGGVAGREVGGAVAD